MTPGIAEQIAELVNARNGLAHTVRAREVFDAADEYLWVSASSDDADAGRIVGCVRVRRVQWYQAEVTHLAVAERHERSGHGWTLLVRAEGRAIDMGARLLQATIRANGHAARRLFQRRGFRPASYFRNAATGHDVVVYQKTPGLRPL